MLIGSGYVTPFWYIGGMGVGTSVGGASRAGEVAARNRARFVPPVLAVEKATLSDLREQLRSISRTESQAAAARARVTAECARRMGQKQAERTVREQTGKSVRGSREEVQVANQLQDLTDTREAFENGEINAGHARAIARAAAEVDVDERELVDKARRQPEDVFAHTVRKHRQERSGDDGLSRLERQRKERKAWVKTDREDGMTVLYGRFDPVTGALIKDALSTRTNQLWRDEHPDHRPTTGQRMADAFAELLCEPRTGQEAGEDKKRKRFRGATLFLVAHYDTKGQQIRDATLADGTPIPVAVFQNMACQGRIVPAVFDTRGRPLWVGMSKRVATPAQRMALVARDRACVGCGADPAWCQAHHVVPWEAGGPTNIDNLCLLCSRCHHQIHDDGWVIRQTPDGKHIMQPPPKNNRTALPIRTKNRRRRRKPAVRATGMVKTGRKPRNKPPP